MRQLGLSFANGYDRAVEVGFGLTRLFVVAGGGIRFTLEFYFCQCSHIAHTHTMWVTCVAVIRTLSPRIIARFVRS